MKINKMDLRNLQFLFKPSYWLMNYDYNEEVDKIVNQLLDKYELTDLCINKCTCKLGKVTIWIENRPYASGRLYGTKLDKFRPSRLTIKRLLKKFYEFRDSLNKEDIIIGVEEFRNKFL
jgi:hypothetical protein